MRKNIKSIIAVSLLSLSPMMVSALELDVDTAHSSVGFDIKHLMVSTVHGNFTRIKGTIDLDEKKFENSKVKFVVSIYFM